MLQKKVKNHKRSLFYSLMLIVLIISTIAGHVVYRTDFQLRIHEVIDEIEYFDRKGQSIQKTTNLDRQESRPTDAHFARLHIKPIQLLGAKEEQQYFLYLTRIKSPIRFLSGGDISESYGNFSKQIIPKVHDVSYEITDIDKQDGFQIEVLLTAITGNELGFLEHSGIGTHEQVVMSAFVRNFSTKHGFTGIGILFLIFSGVLLFLWINTDSVEGAGYLSLVMLSQSWISLYFGRLVFELPLEHIHQISFIAYALGVGCFAKFGKTYVRKPALKTSCDILALTAFLNSLILLVLTITGTMQEVFSWYKVVLVTSGITWILLAALLTYVATQYAGSSKKSRIAMAAGSWLVAAGQLNDILRAFDHGVLVYNIGPYLFFAAALTFLAYTVNRFQERYAEVMGQEKAIAIARMTHLLAHDVRKPFTTIQLAISLFKDAENFGEIQQYLPLIEGEISTSLASVNGLIQDVLEVGGDPKLIVESISPKALVEMSLNDVAKIYPESTVAVKMDWNHSLSLSVDVYRVIRIFTNIIVNACQAMKDEGEIYVKTSQKNDFVEFVLGNTGSHIPTEKISSVFEAFFTDDKKGGTGLGLAIAKKIVDAHGGAIRVSSDASAKTVEFVFTLPVSLEKDEIIGVSERFPLSTFLSAKLKTSDQNDFYPIKNELSEKLSTITTKKSYKIAIVDDEKVYREGVKSCASKLPNVTVSEFESPKKLLELGDHNVRDFDIIILDIDLNDDIDGFDLATILKSKIHFQNSVCFHSNRSSNDDIRRAMELGASTFLPKPLTIDHMVKLIVDDHELVRI